MMQAISQCKNEIRRLVHRLQCVFSVGRSTTPTNDSGFIRMVQVTLGHDRMKDNVPYMQHYGFASNPPVATDFSGMALNGDRSGMVLLASNNQTYVIKNLGDGSVALYDMFGNHVVLSKDGVKVHAEKSYAWDCHGYGERWTWISGTTWQHDTYFNGATVIPVVHNINPPEIP